ncbi:hypothetical protein M0R45_019630 [Rubus argutus]|uniref:GAG-pre-integrase domain-containing protein n=1 Tax=Rubus argutus TaxID=59490 RepID=A0AAW1X811_RUBAR
MSSGELECLTDCGTTHTILRHRQLFLNLTPTYSSVTTKAGPSNLVQGRGPAQFLLPNGTTIDVTHALYAPRDTYWLWHDRLGHPGRDLMIRILKTSNGHPFFRANQSINRKAIQEDKTSHEKGKIAVVRCCRPVEVNMSTGRPTFWMDRFDPVRVADRSMIMPTRSNES